MDRGTEGHSTIFWLYPFIGPSQVIYPFFKDMPLLLFSSLSGVTPTSFLNP